MSILADILGFMGVALGVSWGLLRDRRVVLATQALATLCFCCHYLLIGAYTGAAMNTLTLVQVGAVMIRGHDRLRAVLFWATLPAIFLLMAGTWNGLASVGAGIGMLMATIGRWQSDMLRFRLFFIFCAFGWMTHNLTVGSVFGLASDSLTFGTNLWSLGRILRSRGFRLRVPATPALPNPA